jgi:hypothetical protein
MQPSFADGVRSRTTAGLRQPLLVVRRWFVAKRVIRNAESHTRPRAAGVSPLWSGEPGAVPSKSRSVRRRPTTRPRAAGVSPPWFGEPGAVGLQPRYVGRRPDRQPGAADVSPPWVDKPASAETGAIRRQTADGVCVCADHRCGRVYRRHGANVAPESFMGHTGPDYNRVHWRHGGLTPPALVLVCGRLPAKQRFLRCTNVHSPRSGGCQPAVGGQTRIHRDRRHSSADRRRCVCADHRCGRVYRRHGANVAPESFMGHTGPDYNRVHWRHGGLTPPRSCIGVRTSAGEKRFLRCTNVHSLRSGGCQPAVVR